MVGYPYTYGDYLSSEEARANLTVSRGCSLAFAAGFTLYLLAPTPVHAADKQVTAAARKARKLALKRISNAVGCSAILAVCGKKAGAEVANEAAQAAMVDPKVATAFLCGATVAWCAKYVLFDR